MKHQLLLLCIALIVLYNNAHAQKIIEKHFGKKYLDVAYAAAATDDGGYIITGLTMSGSDTAGDIIIIKTDAHGDTLWTQVYGGPKLEGGNAVIQTADGGFLVSGHTEDFGANDCDAFMLKLDRAGKHEWMKVYGGPKDDIGEGVYEIPGGGYVMAGITESYGNADSSDRRHIWFIRTNSTGDTLWTRCYAGSKAEYAFSIAPTGQNGFLAVGWTMSRGNGEHDAWLLRLNNYGDTLWTRLYQNEGDSKFFKILPTADNGFILAGFTAISNNTKPQGLVVKLDESGNEVWRKIYGEPNEGYAFHDVAQLPDGSFMFTGITYAQDTTGNIYVLKTTDGFEKIADDIYGTNADANTIAVQGNNSYLIAGVNAAYGDAFGDLYFIEKDNTIAGIASIDIPAPCVFPNPMKSKASIILPAAHAYQSVSINVANISGQQLYSQHNVMAKDIIIDRGNLPNGVYLFRITCADGQIFKGEFVVQ